MAQPIRLEKQADVKVSADKLYGFFKSSMPRLAQMFPQNFIFLEVPGGELKTGTVFSVKYTLDGSPAISAKVKIEAADDAKRTIYFDVLEGEVMQFCKSFKPKLQIGDGYAKWSIDAEKKSSSGPDLGAYLELAINVCKGLDAHLSQ